MAMKVSRLLQLFPFVIVEPFKIKYQLCSGEWFNGKTAAFKVADLGSNPCSPAKSISMDYLVATSGRSLSVKYLVLSSTPVIIFERRCSH